MQNIQYLIYYIFNLFRDRRQQVRILPTPNTNAGILFFPPSGQFENVVVFRVFLTLKRTINFIISLVWIQSSPIHDGLRPESDINTGECDFTCILQNKLLLSSRISA
jgi:hypothetical protein